MGLSEFGGLNWSRCSSKRRDREMEEGEREKGRVLLLFLCIAVYLFELVGSVAMGYWSLLGGV